MAVRVGSTTTVYSSTRTVRTSSTSPSSSTTSAKKSTSTTNSASTTSRTSSYSSATAKATSSTSVTYGGSSSTAKVSSTTNATVKATKSNNVSVSSSTTAKTSASTSAKTSSTAKTSSSSNISSSTTVRISSSTTVPTYSYLAHLGGEAIKRAEKILIACGYDDKEDGDIKSGLEAFRAEAGLSSYSTHSYEVATKLFEIGDKLDGINIDSLTNVLKKTGYLNGDKGLIKALNQFKDAIGITKGDIFGSNVILEIEKLSNILKKNKDFAFQLKELGFFNPDSGNVKPFSVQADSATSSIYKAMENFCDLYGKNVEKNNSGQVLDRISEVYARYKQVLESDNTKNVLDKLGANTDIQKTNFSKSWTFLEMGMGFDTELTSAVLANWYEEGAFSETNRQNIGGKYTLDDSDTYKYATKDGAGFGIMQWTYSTRKEDLQEIAEKMSSGVGNLNVQFATFKYEISEVHPYKAKWKNVLNATSIEKKTILILKDIEQPAEQGSEEQAERISKAKIIWKGMTQDNE